MAVDTGGTAIVTGIDQQTIAHDLFVIGSCGELQLTRIMEPLLRDEGPRINEEDTKASLLAHGHAIVWFAISNLVPAEQGEPLMDSHIRYLHEHLNECGLDCTLEDTKTAVGRTWFSFVNGRESGDDALLGIVTTILRNHLAETSDGLTAMADLLGVIGDVVEDVRTVILPAEEPETVVEDPEEFPLEFDGVGRMSPDECSQQIVELDSSPPAMTLVELRRREALRKNLMLRASPQGSQDPVPIVEGQTSSAQALQHPRPEGSSNGFAWTGLVLGVLSIFMWFVGAIPIGAIIFSSIGITRAKERHGKGKVPGIIGLVLGLLLFFLHVVFRGAVALNH